LGINHLHIISNGVVSVNLSAEKAIGWFGAEGPPHVANGSGNDYRFTKVKLFANWYQRFSLWHSTFLFNSSFLVQYSHDT
ncbi:ShlB/FhaC/HecB family hemolysin secretion/activation protein, partial [Escherichia coli]|nr:ShlB/FhaC/HecB family hemolysin secretion/activation protein [Escherichia coli]